MVQNPGGIAEVGSPVTAVARDPNHLDLFVIGTDGGIYSIYWDDASGWASSWFRIREGIAQLGSAVTAVARNPSHLDLFVTGTDGGIYSIYWDDASGWAGSWFRIKEGIAQVGSPVTAVARNPNHMDLFVTGTDGGIYSIYWDDASGWAGSWFRIGDGVANLGSPVTVVPRNPDHMDLFVTGTDGGIYSTYWDNASGWGTSWFRITDAVAETGSPVTAVARNPDHLDLFVTGTNGGIYSTYWDPGPASGVLREVTITFDTHNDNKDYTTLVNVFLKNRRNNSLTPEPSTDYLTNYLALQRYLANGDLTLGEHNPYLACGFALGYDEKFDAPSSRTFTLTLVSDHISVDDVVLPQIDIHMLADGYDQWIFDYTVRLTFDNGTLTFTSAVDGVRGIILDQDNRNHSAIGSENWLRTLPIPVPPKAITDSVLKKVTLQLSTHNDNKNSDTRLNVHIVNRLNASTAQDLAIGLDLFHDQEFPDSGPRDDLYREFSWSAEQNTLASRSIRLSDIVLPMVYIVIEQADEDRWIFDYQVTFEFVDPQDSNQKPQVFSSETRGIVLDQDNNKHAGAYQGRPFPTVAPPTAPRLTYQPVERTGENRKTISIPFLRRKFDEFINSRSDVDTGDKPPLQKIRLGSTLGHPFIASMDVNNPIPLPESYSDMQSLVNGDDGQVHRVRNPQSLNQLKALLGIAANGYESVHHAINGGKMDGFVRSHAELNSDAVAGQVMGYHTGATVPVYDALARDFAIGHRWFASHPGPTYPNRFYELSGRPNLDTHGFWEFHNSSPLLPVFTPTIFDYLNDAIDPISGAPVTWRFFEDGVCSLRRFERYTFDHQNIVNFSDPVDGFLARANTGQLPSVSFIDPHFVDLPPGSNCDEPPGDIADGQKLVQRIVNAVVASPAWNKTLLLIVYDEHGGFYDHVPPPQAARVSEDMPISTSGVRVPAIVVTPWVRAGSVFGYDSGLTNPGPPSSSGGGVSTAARRAAGDARDLHFDHTSILKTIARRFLSTNPPYMGVRYAAANDLSAVIGTEMRHPQFLPFIPYQLQFAKSGMMLDVKFADKAPGTLLWQHTTNGGIAQDFSFEDAGNGFVYIRSHVSNLYVTAQAADSVLIGGATPSAGAKWMLSPISGSVLDRNLFLITNQDYPNVVLQPADPSQSESPVVLTTGSADMGIPGRNPNAWKISSPSLSDEQVTTQ